MFRSKASKRKDKDQSLDSRQVFSYRSYRNGSQRNTGRRQQTMYTSDTPSHGRIKSVVKRVLPAAVFLVIALTLVSTIFLGGTPRVRIMQSDGGIQHTDVNAYQNRISEIWHSDINNLTKLTVNTEKTSQAIEVAFPEIASATIELPLLGRRPLIIVTTIPAAAIIHNQTGSYYVSSNGKLLGELGASYGYNGSKELIVMTDNSGLAAETGDFVLNNNQTSIIRILVDGLEQSGIEVGEVILPAVANQVDIRLENEPYYIKFSLLEDPRQGVGAFLAARDMFATTGQPAEYVDVRVPEKVFYK